MRGEDLPRTYYVSLHNGHLVFDGVELEALSETEFSLVAGDIGKVQFFRDAEGRLTRMKMIGDGSDMEGLRK
jgi:hypothetical protein